MNLPVKLILPGAMVEGPGCKLKGEKMKGKVVGQKVVHVAGAKRWPFNCMTRWPF